MSLYPTIQELEHALRVHFRSSASDPVSREHVRTLVEEFGEAAEQAVDRIDGFSSQGFLPEAYSVAHDFPDLIGQLDRLAKLTNSNDDRAALVREGLGDRLERLGENSIPGLEQVVENYTSEEVRWLSLRVAALEQRGFRKVRFGYLTLLAKEGRSSHRGQMLVKHVDKLEREWMDSLEARRGSGVPESDLLEHLKARSEAPFVAPISRELGAWLEPRLSAVAQRAADARFTDVVKALRAARVQGDLAAACELQQRWLEIHQQSGQFPSPSIQAAADDVFEWKSSLERDRDNQAAHAAAIADLEAAVQTGEGAAGLTSALERARGFGMAVPFHLESRVAQACEVEGKRRFRKRIGRVSASVVVVAGMVVAGFFVKARLDDRADRDGAAALLVAASQAEDLARTKELKESIEIAHGGDLSEIESDALAGALALLERAGEAERVARERAMSASAWLEGGTRTEVPAEPADGLRTLAKGKLLSPETVKLLESTAAAVETRTEAYAKERKAKREESLGLLPAHVATWKTLESMDLQTKLNAETVSRYLAALLELKRNIASALEDLGGAVPANEELSHDLNRTNALIAAAEGWQGEVSRKTAQLSLSELIKKTDSESEFVTALRDSLKDLGGHILKQQGRDGGYKDALLAEAGLRAVEHWRLVGEPALLKVCGTPDLGLALSADARTSAVRAINSYLNEYPGSPYRDDLRKLAAPPSVKRSGAAVRSAQDVYMWASALGVENLQIVECEAGKGYYRRIDQGEAPRPLTHRAINRISDLKSLKPIQLDNQTPTAPLKAVRAVDSEVVAGWRALLDTLGDTGTSVPDGLRAIAKACLWWATLPTDRLENDIHFRLWSLSQMTQLVLNDYRDLIDPTLANELKAWSDSHRKSLSGKIFNLDWVSAVQAPGAAAKDLRGEALKLLANYPLQPGEHVLALEDAPQRWVSAHQPVGVLLPATEQSGGAREARFRNAPPSQSWCLVFGGGSSKFVPLEIVGGKLVQIPPGLCPGPLLLFGDQGAN